VHYDLAAYLQERRAPWVLSYKGVFGKVFKVMKDSRTVQKVKKLR
jgi:hypothetical protein